VLAHPDADKIALVQVDEFSLQVFIALRGSQYR
jgi:hypothetical protein